jgi:hypothetical protein
VQRASVNWVASDGATTAVSLFENQPLNAAAYLGFGVASAGATALATWVPPAPAERVFAIAQKTGNVSTLTDAALPVAADYVVLASNGADYLVVWPDRAGIIRALRVSSNGTVLGAPIAVWNGSDAGGVPGIVAVKAAGSTYLILLRQPVGADGSVLLASRVLADGTLLDPTGFEVPAGKGGVLTGVSDDLWLTATLDSVNGAPIIRGRYIGATTVPAPPGNVEPPPPPDAGTVPDAAGVPDAGAVPDAAGAPDGATASGGGASGAGGAIGSGGDNRGGRVTGSGGRSAGGDGTGADAGSNGTGATAASAGRTTSGGCGCMFARREPAHAHFGELSALVLALGVMRRPRRATVRSQRERVRD